MSSSLLTVMDYEMLLEMTYFLELAEGLRSRGYVEVRFNERLGIIHFVALFLFFCCLRIKRNFSVRQCMDVAMHV